MAFEQGNDYGQGRPPGSRNKASSELRDKLSEYLEKDFDRFKKDFEKLTPFQRMRVRSDLWNYYFPKLRAMELDASLGVSESQAKEIIEQLSKKFIYERYKLPGKTEKTA